MSDMEPVHLAGFPEPLQWNLPSAAWTMEGDQELRIMAGPRTDLFTDPQRTAVWSNAPRLLFTPVGDFVLQARVTVTFAATYDAGVLLLYGAEQVWAKLCFEFSPQAEPMIVSVVTRDFSDDSNSTIVPDRSVLLRVARIGPAFAFHYATDDGFWRFVRHFTLPNADSVAAGFASQSPTGEGCEARFSEIAFAARRLDDLRNGL